MQLNIRIHLLVSVFIFQAAVVTVSNWTPTSAALWLIRCCRNAFKSALWSFTWGFHANLLHGWIPRGDWSVRGTFCIYLENDFLLLLPKHLVFTAAYRQLLLSLNGFPGGGNKRSASVLSLVDKPINTGSQQFRAESRLIVGLEFLIQNSCCC